MQTLRYLLLIEIGPQILLMGYTNRHLERALERSSACTGRDHQPHVQTLLRESFQLAQ
jgi:hypothetical protein